MSAAIVVHINHQRRSLALRGSTSIGRSELCTLRIESRLVSRQHTLIEGTDDRWFIQDLGSRNGTWVNGERVINRRVLRPRDAIAIGEAKIVFVPLPLLFPSLAPERQGEDGHAEVLFRCGNCRQKLRSPFYLSLSIIRCPRCRSRLIVPALADEWDADEPSLQVGEDSAGRIVEGVTGLEAPTSTDLDLDDAPADEGVLDDVDEVDGLDDIDDLADDRADNLVDDLADEPEPTGGGDRPSPEAGDRAAGESPRDSAREAGAGEAHDGRGPRVGGSAGPSVASGESIMLAVRLRPTGPSVVQREAWRAEASGISTIVSTARGAIAMLAASPAPASPAARRSSPRERAAEQPAVGVAELPRDVVAAHQPAAAVSPRVAASRAPASAARAVRVALTQRPAGHAAPAARGAVAVVGRSAQVGNAPVRVDVGSRPSGSGLFDLVPQRPGQPTNPQEPAVAALGFEHASPPAREDIEQALKVGSAGRSQSDDYWASLAAGRAASRPRVRNVLLAARSMRSLGEEQFHLRLTQLPGLFRLGKVRGQQIDDAMSLVCEAMRRAGPSHAPAGQVAGALAMEAGCIAVLPPPGDGSIALAIAAAFAGYRSMGCHVYCVSEEEAAQQARTYHRFHSYVGLTVGHVSAAMPVAARRAAYACDVTYGAADQFMQDVLRDRRQGAQTPAKSGFFRSEPTPEPPMIRALAYAILHDASTTLAGLAEGDERPSLAAGRGVHQLVRQYKRVRGLTRGDGAMRRELWKIYKVPVVPVARLRR
ncbi:MAG: FHA domain-containing protein [Planctomycetota bacterium]|nr:FHA domain-containing protein [Planctomycetota bacterium]